MAETSRTSPSAISTPAWAGVCKADRINIRTWQSASNSRLTKYRPINPFPPVTKTRFTTFSLWLGLIAPFTISEYEADDFVGDMRVDIFLRNIPIKVVRGH